MNNIIRFFATPLGGYVGAGWHWLAGLADTSPVTILDRQNHDFRACATPKTNLGRREVSFVRSKKSEAIEAQIILAGEVYYPA
jgi:hypothetical protein